MPATVFILVHRVIQRCRAQCFPSRSARPERQGHQNREHKEQRLRHPERQENSYEQAFHRGTGPPSAGNFTIFALKAEEGHGPHITEKLRPSICRERAESNRRFFAMSDVAVLAAEMLFGRANYIFLSPSAASNVS